MDSGGMIPVSLFLTDAAISFTIRPSGLQQCRADKPLAASLPIILIPQYGKEI
jgi:hypothetical protein